MCKKSSLYTNNSYSCGLVTNSSSLCAMPNSKAITLSHSQQGVSDLSKEIRRQDCPVQQGDNTITSFWCSFCLPPFLVVCMLWYTIPTIPSLAFVVPSTIPPSIQTSSLSFFLSKQADRAFGSEISQRLFVIICVIECPRFPFMRDANVQICELFFSASDLQIHKNEIAIRLAKMEKTRIV